MSKEKTAAVVNTSGTIVDHDEFTEEPEYNAE
jgi:hypothetical protein